MEKEDIFYQAFLERDPSFEGTFVAGIKTTGIFCRPTCGARKPKRENVEFFDSAKEAMLDGYRACKLCEPMKKAGNPPDYVVRVMERMEGQPHVRITDMELTTMRIEPSRIRRWFRNNYGVTFHAYQRMYRVNEAFDSYRSGGKVTDIAFDSGYGSLSGFNDTFKNIVGSSPANSKGMRLITMTRVETDLGVMIACATDDGICMLEYADRKTLGKELDHLAKTLKAPVVQGEHKYFSVLREQLDLYFRGKLKDFDLPLNPVGTDFQKRVWDILMRIPYGTTTTYGREAEQLGSPSAVRAVANANGMNKMSIIIPCHRVIGADGSLTGYGGGLWRKRKLLALEQAAMTNEVRG